MGKICAFLGHRDAPYYLYQDKHIQREISLLIENEDVDTFWLGGNGDFDKLANNAVKEVQHKYPHIKRVLVVAYQRQIYPFANEEARIIKDEDSDILGN